jgi:hypothetical protein
MGITDKFRQKVQQARTELEGVRFAPSRSDRRAENDAYEAAENAKRTPPTTA